MGKSSARRATAIFGLGLLLAACSGEKTGEAGGIAGSGGSGPSASTAGSGGKPSVCVAGAKRCEGLNVKVCDDAGSSETISETCLPSQVCANGACAERDCVPNTQFCKDNAVWKCDKTGAATFDQQCAASLFCRVEGDSASCSTQACQPGQPVCDGDLATVCAKDGSGPSTSGVDCGKTKQACYGGKCRDIACNTGEKLCEHGDVYLCSHNGTDISLLTDCTASEVCDGEMGACRAKLCDPGKVLCDGTRIQTCNAFGSAWLPGTVDCAADGKICISGTCKKQLCAANRNYCQDGNLYSCDSSGTIGTLSQTCNSQFEHCRTYGSFGTCEQNQCHAGDTLCADNMIKVCNADGSLPASGTSCAANQYCDNAQCKDLNCVPGNSFCKGADVYYCDFSGASLSEQCAAGTACKAFGSNGAMCAALACTPSSTACLGNQIGVCGTSGQTLGQVTNDCTATASICTMDSKCAKSVSDTIGVAENVEPMSASYLVGDVIDVDSARTLTELQAQLVLAGPRELRWIVYELSGQIFVGKFDKVVSNVTGSGFISSGSFSFKLAAGKRYLLAVVVSGGDAIDYIDTQPFAGRVSFGSVIGRVVTYYPSSFDIFSIDPNYVSQMKVTTEAP